MNRGANRQAVFASERDRLAFLALLGEVSEIFAVEVHVFCLMGNHYHLLLHTPRGNLGRAMRHLNGVYTQRHNRAAGRDGPLFRGRYKAILLDADAWLMQVSRYVHRNPLQARLVARLDRYRWSSYRAYIGETPAPDWLCTETILDLFGKRQRASRYRQYVAAGDDAEIKDFYGTARIVPVLGDAPFREQAAARARPAGDDKEIPGARRLTARPGVERIIEVTANAFGVAPAALGTARRGRGAENAPRLVAMALCRNPGGFTLKEIAGAFGVSHYSTVSVAASRLKGRLAKDPVLRNLVDGIIGRLHSRLK
ncbi:MAG: transposase [Proteobacteria bacterium]|nr:transposase [Pseudomonadota bacterium]